MRLLKLKIKNIASLKGEHEIDFEGIQKGSPLFAITGETGAGKSTILNSLGLVLYGQVYKKNVNQLDVVTLGEKEGSIELIFQVKDQYYHADWRGRVRKQNGEPYSTPQTPTRNLYTLTNPSFQSEKRITEKSCAELLNLDFDQFCKCVILNQGEFARFLSSSFTERKEILEKLYPGHLLENLGRELRSELEKLLQDKRDIQVKLSEFKTDETSGETLRSQKEGLAKRLKLQDGTLQEIETLHSHLVSLMHYHELIIENEKKKSQLKVDLSAETTKFNLLLKNGAHLQESLQRATERHDQEIPLYQELLKKEEEKRNLESMVASFKTKTRDLEVELEKCKTYEDKAHAQELMLRSSFTKAAKSLSHPFESLKASREELIRLADLFSELEGHRLELQGMKPRLLDLELQGKELREKVNLRTLELSEIPVDITDKLKVLEEQKKLFDKNQLTLLDSKRSVEELRADLQKTSQTLEMLSLQVKELQDEIFPLETTLALESVFSALEVCVDHALKEEAENCPLCAGTVPKLKWQELKAKLTAKDLASTKTLLTQKKENLAEKKTDLHFWEKKGIETKKLLLEKEKLIDELARGLKAQGDCDQEIEDFKKKSWARDSLVKELKEKSLELDRARENYQKLKNEIAGREKVYEEKFANFTVIHSLHKDLIPLPDQDSLRDLRTELRGLDSLMKIETDLERTTRELFHQRELKKRTLDALEKLHQEKEGAQKKLQELSSLLQEKLKGREATGLIQELVTQFKKASEDWKTHQEAERKSERALKELEVRHRQLEELSKEYELQFYRERDLTKAKAGASAAETEDQKNLFSHLALMELDIHSPREVLEPLQIELTKVRTLAKETVNTTRMNFAQVETRLKDWEKLQDKIQLLSLGLQDIDKNLARKGRLAEVLGKDELRTFVLSLVEENLIHQTNEELTRLCQGRYEILHQTRSLRMTPEFFVLDKLREGHIRKVSTLSGGETFMVSLAMALGLAEMTRGKAEIDSLFIDEGFGTLDQESLEDVLDMLNQIQTRGLMVGIISHIKTLTQAIPVNLKLTKAQDGTSSVSTVFN
jgi:exonuclease SbcC